MIHVEDFASLAQQLRAVKKSWEGKSWKDFPYDSFFDIEAWEDDSDTDLHKCTISENGKEIAFMVTVFADSQLIEEVDLACVDFVTEGEMADCLNLDKLNFAYDA